MSSNNSHNRTYPKMQSETSVKGALNKDSTVEAKQAENRRHGRKGTLVTQWEGHLGLP